MIDIGWLLYSAQNSGSGKPLIKILRGAYETLQRCVQRVSFFFFFFRILAIGALGAAKPKEQKISPTVRNSSSLGKERNILSLRLSARGSSEMLLANWSLRQFSHASRGPRVNTSALYRAGTLLLSSDIGNFAAYWPWIVAVRLPVVIMLCSQNAGI